MRNAIGSVCWLDAGLHRIAVVQPAVLPDGAVVVVAPLSGAPRADGAQADCFHLRTTGASCRLSLEERSEILVTLIGAPPEVAADLELEFERLTDEGPVAVAPAELRLDDLVIETFLAPTGAQRAAAGGFAAAVGDARGIQGVRLHWPSCPPGLILGYSAQLDDGSTTPAAAPGGLVGSRGDGGLLTGFSMFVAGKAAEGLELTIESCFAGDERRSVSGRRLTVAGRTGQEPMLGLGMTLSRLARIDG